MRVAVLLCVLVLAVSAKKKPHRQASHQGRLHQHANEPNPFAAVGLHDDPHFFDVINALETASLFQKGDGTRDLEQQLRSYELAIHDILFDFLAGKISTFSARDYRDYFGSVGTQTFTEKPLVKSQVINNDFMCMPPIRVFAEGMEQFDKYAQGQDVIGPRQLTLAYHRAFAVNMSEAHAIALIKGLQFNPTARNGPPVVTRCEFVKGYMTQRGFINDELIEGTDDIYATSTTWSFRILLDKLSGTLSPTYAAFLKRFFHLDNYNGTSKCEIALVVASCRMHLTTHMMAGAHPRFDPVSGQLIAPPDQSSEGVPNIEYRHQKFRITVGPPDQRTDATFDLFPQTATDIHDKRRKASNIMSNLFVVHDRNGDHSLNRVEFSGLLKSMDMWQDLAVAQTDEDVQRTRSQAHGGLTDGAGATAVDPHLFVDTYDVGLLLKTPMSRALTADDDLMIKVSQIWNSVKDPKKRTLTFAQMAKLLSKSDSSLSGPEAVEAARHILVTETPTRLGGRDEADYEAGLKKREFVHSLFAIPNYAVEYQLRDLELLAGLTSRPAPKSHSTSPPTTEARPSRHAHLGQPVDRHVTRDMHTLMVAIMQMYAELRRPAETAGLTFEQFTRLPLMTPRLASAKALADEASMRAAWQSVNAGSKMDVHEFGILFAEDKPASDDMDIVTTKSFTLAPRLKLPLTYVALSESDALDEMAHMAKVQARAEAVHAIK